MPRWGYSESLLVDGDQVICTPGGSEGAVVALNKKTGEMVWQCEDFTGKAEYSSTVVAELHGVRQRHTNGAQPSCVPGVPAGAQSLG